MIIYRIQNSEGRGPFIPGFSQRWVIDRKDHVYLKPWYSEAGQSVTIMADEHAAVGCRKINQLRRWFILGEYKTLLDLGFMAVRLNVDRIIMESDTQCLFARKRPLWQGATVINLY